VFAKQILQRRFRIAYYEKKFESIILNLLLHFLPIIEFKISFFSKFEGFSHLLRQNLNISRDSEDSGTENLSQNENQVDLNRQNLILGEPRSKKRNLS
jgi:hypothetical protein